MKFERTKAYNFENALRGMRNPMNSWHKSDSKYESDEEYFIRTKEIYDDKKYLIGENDMKLAQTLILAGNEHSKFMRQIFVSVDITAPIYWWKEMDTYKVGTTANSTSTMHKLSTTPITIDCFEIDDFDGIWFEETGIESLCDTWIDSNIILFLEELRLKYLETKDKRYWKELIRWLPESWLQTRTWTANYAVIRNIYFQRRNHKLTEWSVSFIDWIKSLPYGKELIMTEG